MCRVLVVYWLYRPTVESMVLRQGEIVMMVDTGARRIYGHCVNSAVHECGSPRIDILCGILRTLGQRIAFLGIFQSLIFILQLLNYFEPL